jgi:hypothetical protein
MTDDLSAPRPADGPGSGSTTGVVVSTVTTLRLMTLGVRRPAVVARMTTAPVSIVPASPVPMERRLQ